MRGRLLVLLAAVTAVAALPAAAQAGYAHTDEYGSIAKFTALPHEAPDLIVQVIDGGMIFEDRANPFTPGVPPINANDPDSSPHVSTDVPCEILSTHKAVCTAEDSFFWRTFVNTGILAAKVRDISGSDELPVDVTSGPLADDIEINHAAVVRVRDQGGRNRIRLGTTCAFCWFSDSSVSVGPGASTIDVRNATLDYVYCGALEGPQVGTGSGVGPLDTVFVDERDQVRGCTNVEGP